MKCFTVENLNVVPFIAIEEIDSKLSIFVGSEKNKGKLSWIECSKSFENTIDKRLNISIAVDADIENNIVVPNNKRNDDRALVKIYGEEGYRGDLKYNFLGKIETIISGYYCQPNNVGGGEEYLVVMYPESQIKIEKSGRLYGLNQKIHVKWDGQILDVFDPK